MCVEFLNHLLAELWRMLLYHRTVLQFSLFWDPVIPSIRWGKTDSTAKYPATLMGRSWRQKHNIISVTHPSRNVTMYSMWTLVARLADNWVYAIKLWDQVPAVPSTAMCNHVVSIHKTLRTASTYMHLIRTSLVVASIQLYSNLYIFLA